MRKKITSLFFIAEDKGDFNSVLKMFSHMLVEPMYNLSKIFNESTEFVRFLYNTNKWTEVVSIKRIYCYYVRVYPNLVLFPIKFVVFWTQPCSNSKSYLFRFTSRWMK